MDRCHTWHGRRDPMLSQTLVDSMPLAARFVHGQPQLFVWSPALGNGSDSCMQQCHAKGNDVLKQLVLC